MQGYWSDFLAGVKESCQGRQWPVRALFLAWLIWITANHLRDPEYSSILGGLNLGIHEFGHLICGPIGEFIGVLGGSLVQCLVPLISIGMFLRQRDYFAIGFSFVWLGTNLLNVATYIADARALELDLVSPFGGDGEIIHDWNYLLHKMGCLHREVEIAAAVRWLGYAALISGVLWGAWVLWLIFKAPKSDPFDGLKQVEAEFKRDGLR